MGRWPISGSGFAAGIMSGSRVTMPFLASPMSTFWTSSVLPSTLSSALRALMYWLRKSTSASSRAVVSRCTLHHVQDARRAQFVLAPLAGQHLLLQLARLHGGFVGRARLLQRGLRVDHVQLDVVLQLLVLNLRLAVVQLVGDQVGLVGAIADRDVELEAGAVVGEIAAKQLAREMIRNRPGKSRLRRLVCAAR